MKPSDYKNLLKKRIEAGIKRTIMIESSPGIGKTQITNQVAKELKIGFKTIHAPLLQPEDYGLPSFSKDKQDVTFIVPKEKFPLVGSDCPDEGIFLIDEISQSDNYSQKILANLIQEREIHGKYLKPGWAIVATGNRQKDRAGANRILGHLSNRMTRIELEVSLDDWTQWALSSGVRPEVVAFIRFRPELLSNYESNQDVNATPRSWAEGVSQSIGSVPPELEHAVFSGDVGEGPAAELLAFLKIFRNLPNPDTIMLKPKEADVPKDPATLYAVCGAIVARTTQDNFKRAMVYIKRLPPEFSVLYVKDAIGRCPEITQTKDFIDWASKEGSDLLG